MNVLENRIPPPIVGVIFALIIGFISNYTTVVDVSSTLRIALTVIIMCCGFGCAFMGIISFKRAQTTINPLKPAEASSLVNTGIYKHTRNPMYLGMFFLLVALSVFLSAPFSIIGVIGFVVYINRFQIQPEEHALATLFGDEFTVYKKQVRRWL